MSNMIEIDDSNAEISLFDLLVVLARNKKLLILTPLCVGIFTAICTLFMPNLYMGSVKMMPPQQSSSSAAAMQSQLGGGALGGIAGGAVGVKNSTDLYIGLLKSRSILDSLVSRFSLGVRYKAKTRVAARERLVRNTSVYSGKDGLISLDFEDKDPLFASEVANAYVDELDKLLQGLAVTEAGKRRLYFEKQLKRTKDELATAEAALRQTQEKTGLIDPNIQGKAIIESIASLRAQITSREVTLGAMKSFATENNPDAVRLRGEIAELQDQLTRRESPATGTKDRGDMSIPSGNVPELGLEYARKLREVKYHEVLFELMAKQYEMARADEAKEAGTLQIVDRAVPAELKSNPKRSVIVILSFLASFLFAIMAVLFGEARRRFLLDENNMRRVSELKSAILGRFPVNNKF